MPKPLDDNDEFVNTSCDDCGCEECECIEYCDGCGSDIDDCNGNCYDAEDEEDEKA